MGQHVDDNVLVRRGPGARHGHVDLAIVVGVDIGATPTDRRELRRLARGVDVKYLDLRAADWVRREAADTPHAGVPGARRRGKRLVHKCGGDLGQPGVKHQPRLRAPQSAAVVRGVRRSRFLRLLRCTVRLRCNW